MITLTINNSECKLEGLTTEHYGKLKKLLSYKVSSNQVFFSRAWNPYKSLLSKTGVFATGLLYIVEQYLSEANVAVSIKDTRKPPKSNLAASKTWFLDPKAITPYRGQREAVEAALNANRGIISAVTGYGKTLITAMLCDAFKVSTLIVVPNLELKRQTIETLRGYFGPFKVGDQNGDYPITVENVAALDPKVVAEQDLVIIDEFHHAGAKSYLELNKKAWKNVFYRFGLTATPFRSNENQRLLLESVLSQIICRVTYKDAVDARCIVPVEALYVDVPETKIGTGGDWASVYNQLVVNNKPRNEIIYNLLLKLHVAKSSTLCLVKEIKHGLNLNDFSLIAKFDFVKGENEDNAEVIQDFNKRDINVLIGTTGVLGEGVDSKPCEYVIIAGLGRSKNQFMQQVGRGLRKYHGKTSCKIIIFKDESHKFTKRHFNDQVKYLKQEYGVTIKKLIL